LVEYQLDFAWAVVGLRIKRSMSGIFHLDGRHGLIDII
jgi:hypothetical protein